MKKNLRHLIAFGICCFSISAPAEIFLVRVSGQALPEERMAKVVAAYTDLIIEPLHRGEAFSWHSYNFDTDSEKNYNFALILEPKDSTTLPLFYKYTKMIPTKQFRGQPLKLEQVDHLVESATFYAGIHDEAAPNAFVPRTEYAKSLQFDSVLEWFDFTYDYNYAMHSKASFRFWDFLKKFFADSPADHLQVVQSLRASNMAAMRTSVRVVLRSGEVVSGDRNQSPIAPDFTFRPCYDALYEGGNCVP